MALYLPPTDMPTHPVVDACDMGVVHGYARSRGEAINIYLSRFDYCDRPGRDAVDCEFTDGKYRMSVIRTCAHAA